MEPFCVTAQGNSNNIIMKIKALLLLIIFFLLINFSINAQNKDSIAVMESATDFVTAFNNFNWTTFRASFTDDATIFYPFWDQASRIEGRQELDSVWLTIFPEFIDTKNTRKLHINPKDLKIQLYGQTAIVTFHLGDGVDRLSRRTLVMIKEENHWKIAHLHASSISKNNN
jgi:ketosteroid isomerase-like protein